MFFCLFFLQEARFKISPRQKPGKPRCCGEVQGTEQCSLCALGRHEAKHLRQIRLAGALRGPAVRRRECEYLFYALQLVGQGEISILKHSLLLSYAHVVH